MKLRLLLLGCALAVGTGCGTRAAVDDVDALARDRGRLRAELQRCEAVNEANRRRFFAGLGDADEYRTLADLPPIPASFDAPEAP